MQNRKENRVQRCLGCFPCPFPTAMQGDQDKPPFCNNTCNMGNVGRREGSQMERRMSVDRRGENVKYTHVQKWAWRIESQVNSPLTSQELLLYISESPGAGRRVPVWEECEGLGAWVQILPKHRHYHQLGQVHKLFPLVFLYLLNPEINCG